jgi:Fe2+ transport system protein FeoA
MHGLHRRSDKTTVGVPLTTLRAGETGVVKTLQGGHWIVSRLAALGFTLDAEVVMLQNHRHGPIIVTVHDTRIAMGRGQARKIRVVKKETSR